MNYTSIKIQLSTCHYQSHKVEMFSIVIFDGYFINYHLFKLPFIDVADT